MDGMGGGWWMGAGSLIFIVLIVMVVLFVARPSDRSHDAAGRSSAADILSERFARGEIDEDEYRARLDALGR